MVSRRLQTKIFDYVSQSGSPTLAAIYKNCTNRHQWFPPNEIEQRKIQFAVIELQHLGLITPCDEGFDVWNTRYKLPYA